jgi:hypothetical protein
LQAIELQVVIAVVSDNVAFAFELANQWAGCVIDMAANQKKYGMGMVPMQNGKDLIVHAMAIRAIIESQDRIFSARQPIARRAPRLPVNDRDRLLSLIKHEAWRLLSATGYQQ